MSRVIDPPLTARVNRGLEEHGLDAIVASSFENVIYFTGTVIRTQQLIPDRLALAVWPVEQPLTLIVCTIEEAQARAESWVDQIVGYTEFADSPVKVLAHLLSRVVSSRARVGVEMRHLTASYYTELLSLCPNLTFVPADDILARFRMVKTPREVGILRDIALLTDQVVRKAFEGARIGTTERDVAIQMDVELKRSGADVVEFNHVATGQNAKLAHPAPGDTPFRAGQVVRTDFGGRFGGYLSDIARTAVVRSASPRQRSVYEKLFEVQTHVIESARPGLRVSDLFETCKTAFGRVGLDFAMPHIGHGLGLGLHEHPIIHPFVKEALASGMVIAIEPVFRGEDGIYHVEDLIEITDDGARILSRSADWSTLLEIGDR